MKQYGNFLVAVLLWFNVVVVIVAAAAGPMDAIGNLVPKSIMDRIPFFGSGDGKKKMTEEQEMVENMKQLPIRAVVVPKTEVLPPQVVELASKRSGMIGKPLNGARVSECAKFIKQWYHRQGYILSSVMGANLNADGVTELQVEEPKMSEQPINIQFAKEQVIVEDEDGNKSLMSFKEFRKKEAAESRVKSPVKRADLNTTFIETTGRTRTGPIAKTMNFEPGSIFRWDKSRWERILKAGMFERVLQVSPERQDDGTVQLQVIATEKPPRNLEYGVSKSFYTGSWEGEVEFEHGNLFGAGEVAGLSVRRGPKDSYPSIRARYNDDRFGLQGGYGVELFNEYIGVDEEDENEPVIADDVEDEDDQVITNDKLLGRTGLTFSLNHPFDSVMENSAGSASFERTTTRAGKNEIVASSSLEAGPFLRGYPRGTRHSLKVLLTGGGRISSPEKLDVIPFTSGTVIAREIFPLSNVERPITLALKHSVTTSSASLPVHEAKASGVRANIRGYSSSINGAVSNSIVGTTEVRLPIVLPTNRFGQDGTIVLFGDWHVVEAVGGSRGKPVFGKFSRKSSVGIGLRKSIQGIPLKYDISFTEDGKLGTQFSLGGDFDVI